MSLGRGWSLGFAAGLALAAATVVAQSRQGEYPPPRQPATPSTSPADGNLAAGAAGADDGNLGAARVYPLAQATARAMANGGESRTILHGRLARR